MTENNIKEDIKEDIISETNNTEKNKFQNTSKKIGKQTIKITDVSVLSEAAIVGPKEGEGPLREYFDIVLDNEEWNEKTWEKTESKMQREVLKLAADKGKILINDIDRVFSGDLLNQCIGAGFALRDLEVPFFGVYGACSTMIEGISLASILIDGGFADLAAAVTSSHFCTAERQYRTPLEYGGQRPPTAQWTVTGSGSAVLKKGVDSDDIAVEYVTTGKIADKGIKDANNMGGAMAPAAFSTLYAHFTETNRKPKDYDLIVTGDLGSIGSEIVREQLKEAGIDISDNYLDCGCMIYDLEKQDVHAGGSGCGCIGSVLCGYIIPKMRQRKFNRVLAVGTGALLSPTSSLQGESVPGIAHAVSFYVK